MQRRSSRFIFRFVAFSAFVISTIAFARFTFADAPANPSPPASMAGKKKKPKGAPSASTAPAPPPPPAPTSEASTSDAGAEPDPFADDPPPPPPKKKKPKREHPDQADDDKPVESNVSARVATEIAGYSDSERVSVFTPSIAGQVYNPTAGWSFTANYLLDVVSAASADIVSTASPPYHEIRNAGGLSATYKPGDFGGTVVASVSNEPDYLSLNAGGSATYDLYEKNASLLLGYTYGHDTAGRNSTPFSVFERVLEKHSLKGGLTYILNRRALLTFIADAIIENGDQSKPYRFIPIFAPGAVVPPGISIDNVNAIRLPDRPAELLPLSRDRYALTMMFAHRFDTATIRVEERLYTDSWGLKASTTDFRFLLDLGPRVTVGPHLRLHSQTPVVFWQRAYTSTGPLDLPALRTGDRELGPLTSVSGGSYLRVYLGSAGDPRSWAIGLDTFITYTSYPDDLYLQSRLAGLGALSLEANF